MTDFPKRPQVELTYYIGYRDEPGADADKFKEQVIRVASTLCGGCTVNYSTGYWMSDGSEDRFLFSGELQSDRCLQIVLTCEPHKEDMVYEIMRDRISVLSANYGVDTDWVHVSRKETQGMHFSCKQHRARYTGGSRLSPSTMQQVKEWFNL